MRRLISLLVVMALATMPQAESALGLASWDLQQNSPPEALVIVVNHSNELNDLSSAELRNIFLGRRSHWGNGRRITLVMREPGDPERLVVLREICGMSEDQLKTHFIHGLYTGEILTSPKTLATPLGVRKFIFNVPGAIGYLRLSDVDASVKAVRIDGLLPEERGYKFHVRVQEPEPRD
jgi:ABC-type phosphate transport system substrate-binding protein